MREETTIVMLFVLGITFGLFAALSAFRAISLNSSLSVKKAKQLIAARTMDADSAVILPAPVPVPLQQSAEEKKQTRMIAETIPEEALALLEKIATPVCVTDGWIVSASSAQK